MKISIITVCYNSANTLTRTIESVLAQSYKDIEFIVVDGGSSDGTIEIINSYSNKISKWISEPDKGIYDAFNKGVLMATGDFVGFLHADDVFASNDIVVKIAELAIDNDAIYGDLQYVSDNNRVIRNWISGRFEFKKLKLGWMPPHPTLYVRRDIYSQVGTFNLGYKIAGDYDFMLRLLSVPNIRIGYLSEVIVLMKVGGASNKSLRNIIRKSTEDYKALKSNKIGGCFTLFLKNFGKLHQFISR